MEAEILEMEDNPFRLLWEEGLPEAIHESVLPYRDRLDPLFCSATAGLEMDVVPSEPCGWPLNRR